MTYEEALNVINTWLEPMRNTLKGTLTHEFLDAVEVLEKQAISDKTSDNEVALEKQEFKKPKVYDAHPAPIYMCPACDSTFITRFNTKSKMSYCNNCGQAISWEEVEG